MSRNEQLDDHMRNGTDYINLPTNRYPTDRAPTWIRKFINRIVFHCYHVFFVFIYLAEQKTSNNHQVEPRQIRYLHQLQPTSKFSQLANDLYASHQQMDAEDRLQELEVIRPTENINLLNTKFHHLQHPRHARPILPQYRDDYVNTLYDQMGTYIQERSGLYHTTNYDPNGLAEAIPDLAYLQENINTESNQNDADELLNTMEKTQNRARPILFQRRALGDYQNMRVSLVI